MRNLKLIAFLIIGIGTIQINAQTADLEATVIKAKALYAQLKTKENNPLYVVNGIELKNSESVIAVIKAEDVDKIDVLKGDTAKKNYGDRGINGVILITLKTAAETKYKKILDENILDPKFDKNQYPISVSGVIFDDKKNPISEVLISNLTKNEAYYSDSSGKFKINVAKNDLINFSKIGFEPQRIEITNQSALDIVLKPHNDIDKNNIIIKKPVIYLYPTTKTDVTIQLDFKGKLLTTFPKYDTNWTVTAYPDGRIFDKKTNRFYSSLFWDGNQKFPEEHYQYKSGFSVNKNDLTNFLIEKLDLIGLNNTEANEFIQYWLPILEKNETNFIHFYINSDYDIISKNDVSPKPDTSIRLFMEFYNLEKPIELPEQQLSKTERKGFTLVEWGGSDVSEPVKEINKLKL